MVTFTVPPERAERTGVLAAIKAEGHGAVDDPGELYEYLLI